MHFFAALLYLVSPVNAVFALSFPPDISECFFSHSPPGGYHPNNENEEENY